MAGNNGDDDDRRVAKRSIPKKFTQKSSEYKKLEKLFRERKISPCDKPSDVRATDPDYMAFTTVQFRSQFNKLKGIYGTGPKDGKLSSRSDVIFLQSSSHRTVSHQ